MTTDVSQLTVLSSSSTGLPLKSAEQSKLQARVRSVTWEAQDVLSLDLVAADGSELPPFEPGAHIDLHFPDGSIRQYSLWGNPSDRSRYRVGIRAVEGGHSSLFVHRKLRPGDVLTVSTPRNNFPLIDASRYVFVAGGIGITPLIPMMRTASEKGRAWTLYYCNHRKEEAPFLSEIEALGGQVSLHTSDSGTRLDVAQRLGPVQEDTVVYCCGPERLMSAVEEATAAWPKGSVRFEWFAPRSRSTDEPSGAFELTCESSGITLTVPPEKSVLEVLNEAGIDVPCSCQQGICGTCEVRVISGEVDHRDSILSEAEREANQSMMTCISRARGPRLVLEI
jgi:ferredoxin-NADP reductase